MNDKEFYTGNIKRQIEERNRPLDTTQLQLDSVTLFMRKLGYGPHHPQEDSPCAWKGFIKRKSVEGVNLPKCISFQDSCRIHNIAFRRSYYLDAFIHRIFASLYYSLNLDAHRVSCESKLIEKVYLQRKGKTLKCQQHWVKFV